MKPFLLALAVSVPVFAQDAAAPEPAPEKVEVSALRHPDLHKYRSLVAGLDAFEEYHALAPAAPELRFVIKAPRHAKVADNLDNLTLRLVGEGEPISVPLAPDHTFTLPRIQSALDEDAELVLNRKKGAVTGRPLVVTPGLAANVRRLGDMRLECRVIVGIAKKEIGLLATGAINTLLLTTDWCSSSHLSWGDDAPSDLESAIIRDGNRSAELHVRGRGYSVPLNDRTWSNDALIELTPVPPPTPEEKAKPFWQPLYVFGTMDHWSPDIRLRKREDGVFEAKAKLARRTHEFRIGTSDQSTVDLAGAEGGQLLTAGAPQRLAAKGKNLQLVADKEGVYVFTLDVRAPDNPQLTVRPE
jgi:hypothetical protein